MAAAQRSAVRTARGGRALRAAAAAASAALALFPLLHLTVLALAGPWPAPALLPVALRFDRLAALTSGADGLGASLLLSLALSLAVAALSTALGLLASRQLARARRRQLWLALAYLPFAISPVVSATCLQFFYVVAGLSGSLAGVLLAQTGVSCALATVLLVGVWNAERRGLEEVARTLGANSWQVWTRVLVPSARPLLRVCFFQAFLLSWLQYGLTLVIGAGKVRTLPVRVFAYVLEADLSYAALAALLLILPPLALLWVERRVLLRGV